MKVREALVLGLAAAACRTSEPVELDATTPTSDTADSSPTTSSTDPCAEEDPGVAPGTGTVPGHIHNVAIWGCSDEVVFGTHAGTWRTRSGATELVQLAAEGDFMGLVQDPHEPWRYFGSGHFHDASVGNSGLLESTDGGVTWTSIALEGTDFHQIATSADQPGLLVGAYEFAFYVSEDHGRTWEEHSIAPLEVTGLVVADPEGPVILFSSENGIERRALPDFATELLVDADVSGLARHGDGLAYATAAGEVYLCDLELTACTPASSPEAGDPVVSFLFAPEGGTTWVVTAASNVWRTDDIEGGSWDLVASQEGTHTH